MNDKRILICLGEDVLRMEPKDLTEKKMSYESMRQLIGGILENVPKRYGELNTGKYTFTVHEEGRLLKLKQTIVAGTKFHGPVVITWGNGAWSYMTPEQERQARIDFGLGFPEGEEG